jgi:hypothetical protein
MNASWAWHVICSFRLWGSDGEERIWFYGKIAAQGFLDRRAELVEFRPIV